MKKYGIKEVSELTEIKAHTLRYYESIGLIENIEKDSSGRRSYTEENIEWIKFIKKAKKTKMKINKMLEYSELRKKGLSTALARKKILEDHLKSIEEEINMLNETKDYIEWKIQLYNNEMVK